MEKVLKNPFADGRGDKCFGCSKANPHGLGLVFAEDSDGVVCRWRPDARFQSWDGILHGGITTTILDETAGWAVMRRFQRTAVTTRIEVRFLKPVPVGDACIVARARYVDRVNEKVVRFHAVLENALGDTCAEAEAEYYVMDEARSREMGFTACVAGD